MTDEPRRIAIRKWTCPHHPDGPPTLPADGFEREELTLEQAYGADTLNGLLAVYDAFENEGPGAALRALGVCCLGHHWYTAGYRDQTPQEIKMEPLNDLLRRSVSALYFQNKSVFFAELVPPGEEPDEGDIIRIPLITGQTERHPGTLPSETDPLPPLPGEPGYADNITSKTHKIDCDLDDDCLCDDSTDGAT